jgi:1-acyl-sn-glycerol-3-phosphate acyltransferase
MWNVMFLVTGAIFILLLMVVFFSKEVINSKENQYFKYLIVANFVGYTDVAFI